MPIDLVPTSGRMTARVFENTFTRLPPTLFFDIEIFLKPFEFEEDVEVEIVNTSVRLDFIKFQVPDWRDLAGQEFHFPKNPQSGYIDGSIYLGGAHNPADATRIR